LFSILAFYSTTFAQDNEGPPAECPEGVANCVLWRSNQNLPPDATTQEQIDEQRRATEASQAPALENPDPHDNYVTPEFVAITNIPVDVSGESGLANYLNFLYLLSIAVAVTFAIIKIALAGTSYMMSDVVTSKEGAKKDIYGALLGLLIILSTFVVLSTISDDLISFDVLGDTETFTLIETDRVVPARDSVAGVSPCDTFAGVGCGDPIHLQNEIQPREEGTALGASGAGRKASGGGGSGSGSGSDYNGDGAGGADGDGEGPPDNGGDNDGSDNDSQTGSGPPGGSPQDGDPDGNNNG